MESERLLWLDWYLFLQSTRPSAGKLRIVSQKLTNLLFFACACSLDHKQYWSLQREWSGGGNEPRNGWRDLTEMSHGAGWELWAAPTHTAKPHCPGSSCCLHGQHRPPQLGPGLEWTKRCWFKPGHCSERSLCSARNPGRAPGSGNSSFPSFHLSHRGTFWAGPQTPTGQINTQCLRVQAELSHLHALAFPAVAWGTPSTITAFSLWGVTSFNLDFFSLLASPSLSFSQWLMSFSCLERN